LRGAENSDVSPVEFLVAVAVIFFPAPTLLFGLKTNESLPEESVVTVVFPTNVVPSSVPAGVRGRAVVVQVYT